MDNIELGRKIFEFRKKAGMSQLDLELEINASPGSISRIESGKVNPTKETLSKIGKALELNSIDIASLININILTPEPIIKAINKISLTLNPQSVLQEAVDSIFNLYDHYNGGVLFITSKTYPDRVYGQAISKMPYIEKIYKILPLGHINKHYIDINNKENLIARSILNKKFYESSDLYDFCIGGISKNLSFMISKILGFQQGISFPLIFENKVLGAVLFTKRKKISFSDQETYLLNLLTEHICIAIKNAHKFKDLQITNNGKTNFRSKN